jgi:translation initiation factor 2B subunit (eIF-2B alpha/beta/delta family)
MICITKGSKIASAERTALMIATIVDSSAITEFLRLNRAKIEMIDVIINSFFTFV